MKDYEFIRKWENINKSSNHFIKRQIDIARKDGAPQNAIYKTLDGSWATADDIITSSMRKEFGLKTFKEILDGK